MFFGMNWESKTVVPQRKAGVRFNNPDMSMHPALQKYFREHKPFTVAVWGGEKPFRKCYGRTNQKNETPGAMAPGPVPPPPKNKRKQASIVIGAAVLVVLVAVVIYSRRIPIKSTAPAALMAAWNQALVEIFADVASDFRSREIQ